MELVCRIGTQGLPDGRVVSRGDIYEVDDDTASTLVAAGYAKASTPTPKKTSPTPPIKGDGHASHFGDGKEGVVPKARKTTRAKVVKK